MVHQWWSMIQTYCWACPHKSAQHRRSWCSFSLYTHAHTHVTLTGWSGSSCWIIESSTIRNHPQFIVLIYVQSLSDDHVVCFLLCMFTCNPAILFIFLLDLRFTPASLFWILVSIFCQWIYFCHFIGLAAFGLHCLFGLFPHFVIWTYHSKFAHLYFFFNKSLNSSCW